MTTALLIVVIVLVLLLAVLLLRTRARPTAAGPDTGPARGTISRSAPASIAVWATDWPRCSCRSCGRKS